MNEDVAPDASPAERVEQLNELVALLVDTEKRVRVKDEPPETWKGRRARLRQLRQQVEQSKSRKT